jgi:predicted Rossmann fold flavoprotein
MEWPSGAPDPLSGDGPGDPSLGGPAQVVVLGGGAAGLWAAGRAAERGLSVLLLEKNPRVGVKILASGGGACNLTTTLSAEEAARWFRPRGARFLGPALRALSPQDVVARFAALGVPTETESALEKVWPVSRRARDVAEALLAHARRAGARVLTSTAVRGLEREDDGWRVATARGAVTAREVVVAVGGRSYPRTGTTGDAYAWLAALGHTIVPPRPALAPLVVDVAWVRALTGIALDVEARAVDARGRTLLARRRPLLFTHTGLSGPAAMDVSRWFGEPTPPEGPVRLLLDLAPGRDEGAVRRELDVALSAAPRAPLARALPDDLPERVRRALLEQLEPGLAERPASTASREQRHRIVETLKRLELPVAGTRGFDFAEVTAGGVALDEVDPGTLRSRKHVGLFLVGEVLDLDGPIGGFSFQAAFSTAELAARSLTLSP